jgi:uncharacterized membrane protein
VNLKAELEVAELHKKMDHMGEEILARLARLERSIGNGTNGTR